MPSTFLTRTRRWIGASTLAILVGLGGGSAFIAATAPTSAQMQPAAQISVPNVNTVTGFADLVDAVQPAVVSIIVESEQATGGFRGRRGGGEFNFRFPDLPEDHPFRDFFDQFGDQFGAPGERAPNGEAPTRRVMAAGSGFAISADGYFVTNNHVVENASKVTVVFENGNEEVATIVGTDERTDLAVVKVDGVDDLPFVSFTDDEVRVGDWVVAVGNPFGLGGTVTAGIVSARGRDIAGSAYGDFLQIDAAVNTGNSGGPAFNLEGEVVGVNTAIFSPTGGNVGIAFAIPANVVKQVTAQLIETGSVTRGFLGVSIQDVSPDIADSVGLERARGALVTEPSEGGPAAEAGIQSGDVILSVDGEAIEDALDLSRTIASKNPDTDVELVIWRDGSEQTLSVTLGVLDEEALASQDQQPVPEQDVPEEPEPSSVGITVVPNSGGEGVLIQDVDPDSVAASKGLAVGDTILEVNNQPVSTADEFEEAISAVRNSDRNTALIKTERDGNIRFVGLPLDSED
ncbi:MAG TPA: Do family serine endopeptidase [Devosiaceae bacterium]|jgi:serine protease Do|nr:Do family serine endopeptidase [Devosiaceae bacterium]